MFKSKTVNIGLSQILVKLISPFKNTEKYCPNRATSTHSKTVKCVWQLSLHKTLPTALPLQAQFIYVTTFILANSTFSKTRALR
jgi:hypothetical protein